jgi:uncharacterized protein YrrD
VIELVPASSYIEKLKVMKRNIKNLIGYTIGTTDGEIGKVKEFYFDDRSWTIRYLIVETGSWLSGRKVLISPEAVLEPYWEEKIFPVNLTKEQIKNSPDIDTDKPVSRQQEIKLYQHYPWTSYRVASIGMTGIMMPPDEVIKGQDEEQQNNHDPNLLSTERVKGYNIKAIDGEIGDIVDFVIDDRTWKIHFMIVDTGNWFPGKKVIISPSWIKAIKWDTSSVIVNASIEDIKNSPEYEPGEQITDSYEANLQNYYGRYIHH